VDSTLATAVAKKLHDRRSFSIVVVYDGVFFIARSANSSIAACAMPSAGIAAPTEARPSADARVAVGRTRLLQRQTGRHVRLVEIIDVHVVTTGAAHSERVLLSMIFAFSRGNSVMR
jgi:hypothetical protein